ncbi:hypothetical protein LTR47_003701 [Exophiala xenobiotica]|nr:hypothetical protein LTR47_003701 [Exophiala xenobiotica]KAK5245130.1 hypothetical protein LTS06_009416 [Exophiala xenobiotica]KAK5259076.1 hypothetical protein LTR40_006659 [Exophiala xenobiotica]KAK5347886.1 hypothetical protein LTR61_008515 [Exophiala xenobiotica]KAK5369647.1 hypothetical protein LTR11_006979 [Exophiala xenobiotica]
MTCLRWYAAAVGASTSKIDDAKDISVADSSPPGVSRSASQLTPLVESPLESKSSPKCNRLPPVQSRTTVISEVSRIRGWRLIDASDDLYESTANNHSLVRQSNILHPPVKLETLPAEAGSAAQVRVRATPARLGPARSTPALPGKRASSASIPANKKRRLIATSKAVEIALHKVEEPDRLGGSPRATDHAPGVTSDVFGEQIDWSFFNKEPQLGYSMFNAAATSNHGQHNDLDLKKFPLYQDEDFAPSEEFEDEGYHSLTVSPTSKFETLSEEQKEAKLVQRLASLQRENIVLFEPDASVNKWGLPKSGDEEEEEDLKEARQWMLQEQEAGAERSRILREQALQRKRLEESTNSPTSSKTEADSDHTMLDKSIDDHSDSDVDMDEDVDDQEPDEEGLLDIAQQHVLQRTKPRGQVLREPLMSRRHRKDPNALNPASRAAAEQFRTQSRHLSHSKSTRRDKGPCARITLEERERRLRELTRGTSSESSLGRSVRPLNLNSQFTEDDFERRPRQVDETESYSYGIPAASHERREPRHETLVDHAGGQSAQYGASQRMSGLETLARKRSATLEFDEDALGRSQSSSDDTRNAGLLGDYEADQPPTQRLSGLDMLARKHGLDHAARPARKTEPSDSRAAATQRPLRGVDITLPPSFDKYTEEDQKNILDHEIAKERKRDLEAIERSVHSIAYLRCLGVFTDTDQKELNEVRKFIVLVIDQGESGKMRRKRIQDIRDNMKRRADGFQEPASADVSKWLKRIFPGKLELVTEELAKAEDQVSDLGALRRNISAKRHNKSDRKRGKKQVRFAEPSEEREIKAHRTPKLRQPNHGGANATENRRLAQYARQDKVREHLKSQLQLFNEAEQPEVIDLPGQSELDPCRHTDSEESEEDEGAQYVYGAGRNAATSSFTAPTPFPGTRTLDVDQDIQEINRLEDARQKESETRVSQHFSAASQSQALDTELLKKMQAKKALQDLGIDLEAIKSNTATEVEAISDTDSSSSSDDDSEDEDRQVFEYTVWAVFAGIPIYKVGEEYWFKKTYDLELANRHVGILIQAVNKFHRPADGPDSGDYSLASDFHGGLMEQHLKIGQDVKVEARIWVGKKLVDLDKKAFRSAKARKYTGQQVMYTVDWEKTVTPVVDEADIDIQPETSSATATKAKAPTQSANTGERGEGAGEGEDDLDSLFGDDPTPPPEPAEQVLTLSEAVTGVATTNSRDETRFFSTSVLANRHAKDLYMAWYATFLPGVQNEGYRRLEDEAVEKQLESMGTWGLWNREESFTRVASDHESVNASGRRVEEKYEIWVRKVGVLGPRN